MISRRVVCSRVDDGSLAMAGIYVVQVRLEFVNRIQIYRRDCVSSMELKTNMIDLAFGVPYKAGHCVNAEEEM